jgi:transcriptional regulator GlxA family with amidase domain
MDMSNFGVALDGRAVVFDAATIQALPKTLADFTLLRTTKFANAVSAYVFDAGHIAALEASPNFMSLTEVRICLSTGNDDLGKFDCICFCWVLNPRPPLSSLRCRCEWQREVY